MKIILLLTLVAFTILSCKESSTDLAIRWSDDIKIKIIEDVNIPVDSITIDSGKANIKYLTLFSNGIKTKNFGIRKSDLDTIVSIFYSKDQKFELVRELCSGISRSFEGIKYEGRYLGVTELKFCDGKLKERGYNFNGKIGVWTEWDEDGKVIKETDYGLLSRLNDLNRIQY